MNELFSRKNEADSSSEAMTPDALNDVFILPATPNQIRFWLLDQIQPGNPALNMPLAWSCRGSFDFDIAARALSGLVSRHETLRTTFDMLEGKLSQVIQSPFPMRLPLDDLTSMTEEERKLRVEELIRQEARMAMNLKTGPLFFGRVIRLNPQEHVFLVTMHHSICDGWSNGVMLRDFAAIYDGLAKRQDPELPELEIQFGDFSVWLEEWRRGPESAESLDFWRKTLDRGFTPFKIQHDVHLAKGEDQGEIETLLLPPGVVQRVRDFCASQGITQYMLLLAVYSIALHRITGLDDLLIGSPCANRRPGTENLIGPFANPQVMRSRLSHHDSFRTVLDRVRKWTLGAIAHQDLPFEDLVEDPFFSGERNQINLKVYFVYQRAFMQTQHGSNLDIVPIRSVSPGATFELMLSIVEREEGPRLQLEYNPYFFRVNTIRRMLTLYSNVLESGLSDLDREISALDILDPAELELVTEAWNETGRDFGTFESVVSLIESQVNRTPHLIAAICENNRWTYHELNDFSNRVARRILKQVRTGSLIAVCMERSLSLLGVLLGIWKAGCAYLPLDPTIPSERNSFIIENAEVPLLITETTVDVSALPAGPFICIDLEAQSWGDEDASNPNQEVGGDRLAYVLYTSGSTGKPKGVAVEHRSLTNLLKSMIEAPGMKPEDTMVAVTTISFDISILELFLPLIVGAKLVIASRNQVKDAHQLVALIGLHDVTVMQSTPNTWRMLMEGGWKGKPRLKVLCGGEALPPDLAQALVSRSDEVWNLYGPTETTIWSSVTRVTTGPVRIGPPIANTQFYILDEYLKPVPVGVVGELFIAGAGLARGYWRNPDLTAERFLPNSFGPGRMYRSGDLARWNEGGSIELLGRLDNQVKIAGFRIELGEIENELAAHPAVREAVAAAVEDEVHNKRLAAWVSLSTESAPADLVVHLHALLRSRLPDYMLPVSISILSSLPRTPNGKIDRKNLPSPNFGSQVGHRLVKPRNETERKLLPIWRSVLGIENISVEANFFELGGNSLMILRLIARVNTAFQSFLPIPIIYTAPTIEKMAAVLTSKEGKDFVLALQPHGTRPPLFMIQSYHLYRTLPASLGGDQPFYGVRELELEDRNLPYTLDDLVESYVRNIREIQPKGPYYLSGFCFFALLAFAVADEFESQGEEVAFLGLIDANCPSYWHKGASQTGPWKRFRTVLRYHWKQIQKFPVLDGVGYAGRFLLKKIWNRMLSFSLWARHGVYSYFISRQLRLPAFLRNKAMVTRVVVRRHVPNAIKANIYLFPASDQPYPDNFDTALGWSAMTQGRVETVWLPGSHEDMFLESNIDVMAQKLSQVMNRVEQTSSETAHRSTY